MLLEGRRAQLLPALLDGPGCGRERVHADGVSPGRPRQEHTRGRRLRLRLARRSAVRASSELRFCTSGWFLAGRWERHIVPNVLIDDLLVPGFPLAACGSCAVVLNSLRGRLAGAPLPRARRAPLLLPLGRQHPLCPLLRVVLDLVPVLLPPLVHLPLHALLQGVHGVGVVGELVLLAHRILLALPALRVLNHVAECLHVPVVLVFFFLLDAAPLGPLLLEAAAIEGLGGATIFGEHRSVVEVPQLLAVGRDALPVVRDLGGARIALEVQHPQVDHAHEDLRDDVGVPVPVVLQVEGGHRAIDQLDHIVDPLQAYPVPRDRQGLQLPQRRDALDPGDEVVRQVEVPELHEALQALDSLDAVLLQEEAPEVPAALEPLDLAKGVALGIQRPQVRPALEVLDSLPALVVDVQLVVELLCPVVHAAVTVYDLPKLGFAHFCSTHSQEYLLIEPGPLFAVFPLLRLLAF
mmetsp:Transcript_11679/g.33050  ORF Transcript_11679/g.33050 Transcript_11679/m.33050 type:complete len:465 (-) Transcript_11679:129-1523(-)